MAVLPDGLDGLDGLTCAADLSTTNARFVLNLQCLSIGYWQRADCLLFQSGFLAKWSLNDPFETISNARYSRSIAAIEGRCLHLYPKQSEYGNRFFRLKLSPISWKVLGGFLFMLSFGNTQFHFIEFRFLSSGHFSSILRGIAAIWLS